jgi:LPXTG-motif cell wall-anchored protein
VVREATLPPDFRVTVDGKEIGLADVKPGMKGVATITTTTTTKPITVTEVRNADVLAVTANNLIVRDDKNVVRRYTIQDIESRNVTIMKDGQPIDMNQLRAGDKLTATIITRKPPQVIKETQVAAAVQSPDAPPSAMAAAPAASAPAASAPADTSSSSASSSSSSSASMSTKSSKKLPKTGSDLPLVAGLGSLLLATGLCLTVIRRRKTA